VTYGHPGRNKIKNKSQIKSFNSLLQVLGRESLLRAEKHGVQSYGFQPRGYREDLEILLKITEIGKA